MVKGQVNFDCAIQRGFTWDSYRKSLFIHTLLEGFYMYPFSFVQNEDRKFDGLDGKQRTYTVMSFVDNGFELEDGFTVVDEEGEIHDFSSYTFKDLPEWAQQKILNYSVDIIIYHEMTEEQYQEQFFRLNYGKPLTPIELTRVKTPALRRFQEMAKHDLVNLAVTDKGKQRFNHENLVMQAWAICFPMHDNKNLSFETKVFRPFMEQAEVSDREMKEVENLFNIIYNMYNSCDLQNRVEKKVATKIKTRTHLVSLCRAVSYGLENGYTVDHMTEWVKAFFSSGKETSVDGVYNAASGVNASGVARRSKIDERIESMMDHMDLHMQRYEEVEQRNVVGDAAH